MSMLHQALRAGQRVGPAMHAQPLHVLVAGGGGALGAAVLEQLLGAPGVGPISVLVTQPLATALRGLLAVPQSSLDQPAGAERLYDAAVIVFDRSRHANGRERAFARPEPAGLVELASALHARGVRQLVIVMPHASASLPEALKRGLASLDEQAVAALGFEHVVIIRSAEARSAARSARLLQRLADMVLAQLNLMVPQRDRPVRAAKVAAFAVAVLRELAQAPPGTRVAPPELVWLAAQVDDVQALAQHWLHGRPLPEAHSPRMRM